MPWKGNAPMPSCNVAHQQEILDAIAGLRGHQRKAAEALVEEMGAEELCVVLHAMRRWYSYNCWNAAKKIIPHRAALLSEAMDLDPPIGVYRGFKVDVNSPLLDGLDEGDVIKLPVTRNGGCSSWTGREDIADRFSGGGRGKVGLVIRLVGGAQHPHLPRAPRGQPALVEQALRHDDGHELPQQRGRVRAPLSEGGSGDRTHQAPLRGAYIAGEADQVR